MKQQTAIEWLIRVLELESFENINLYSMTAIDQAKAMEKEQIEKAFEEGMFHHTNGLCPNEYYKEIYEAQND
jgi:hypothetical protein